ncbi:hypothetical protein [Synechococcus sp. PCC 6312]|uniref:hypothetical protein n=1 Tax=Synechococcus sp. (strain ATCC 27167 / PCC 6312) TaxID=195253 RepID=UPI0002D340F7|nr:hypothetical protein [Synechococcus sp. PCC 6312]
MDANLKKFFAENGLVNQRGETVAPPDDDVEGWKRNYRALIQCWNFMLDEQEAAVENRRASKYLMGLNSIGYDFMDVEAMLKRHGLNPKQVEQEICQKLGCPTLDKRNAQNREFMKRMAARDGEEPGFVDDWEDEDED